MLFQICKGDVPGADPMAFFKNIAGANLDVMAMWADAPATG